MAKNWESDLAETCLGYLDQGISVMCSELKLIFINQRFKDLLQLPEELMVIGTQLDAVFRYNASRGEYGPGDIETLVEERMALARKKEPHSFERIRPDGVILKIDGNCLPDGGFVTTYSDITELYNSRIELQKANDRLDERVQQRAKELAASESKLFDKANALETIMESVGSGLALFDLDLNLVTSNRYFIDILGYPEEFSRPGTPIEKFVRFNAMRGDYGDKSIELIISDVMGDIRKCNSHEEIQKRKDGRYIELLWRPTANGMVASYTDVTEQIRAEEFLKRNNEILEERVDERTAELRTAKEIAERASTSKSQFLANMSHELRTPLNAIIGFSELLMMGDYTIVSSEKRLEYAADVNAAGVHLLHVINDILDVAKIEANQIKLEEKEVEIRSLVDPCVQMLTVQAQQSGVSMEIDIPTDLPRLIGDPTRIKQIIANLLSNAVKFTDSGGTVRTKVTLQDDQSIQLSVIDNGIGIADSDIDTVQTQFGQAHSSYSRNHQGTGLGLSLVSLLTKAHGGNFKLESKLGKGTTATVKFPPGRTKMRVPELIEG